jgi:cell division protein FtsL
MKNHLLITGLFLVVTASAMGVVYSKHMSRKLFVELQALNKEQDRMDVEWGRLQLEQSTWATHGRIETIARDKLNMHIPSTDKVIMIRP